MLEKWQLDLLRCDVCQHTLVENTDKDHLTCLSCHKNFPVEDGVVINQNTGGNDAFHYYEEAGGSTLFQRSKETMSTSFYETKKYYQCLEENLTVDNHPVLEVGCGDGRIIDWLLHKGFTRIVANDFNIRGLVRYKSTLSAGDQKKVLFINSDLLGMPLKQECFKTVIAIEVLYYLHKDFKKGCERIHRLLRNGGVLINSEPTEEGALLYSLINHDVEDFMHVFSDRTKKESSSTKMLYSKVFQPSEITFLFESIGFRIKKRYGISAFPNLVMPLLKNWDQLPANHDKLKNILEALVFRETGPYRCRVYLSKKHSH